MALVALSLASVLAAPSSASAEMVRVKLERLKESITITGMGLRFPGSTSPGLAPFRALRVQSKPAANGLRLWTLVDRDTGALISKFRAKTLELAGFNVRVNLKPAPERLSLVPPSRGKGVDLIAQMDIEEYVRGVLPAEMPANWPIEALKAQAVAARTFALYRRSMRERAHAPYHLESTVMDQVFLTPLEDDRTSARRANVERAIRETRGIVMRDPMKRPFATYFHADCGGHTEDARKIWGGEESLGTATDDACPMNPLAKWRARLTTREITERLKAATGVRAANVALVDLETLERSASGRIDRMVLKWSDGEEKSLSGHQFRMAVGFDKVRSTNFEISKSDSGFELEGRGYGHGVGMCQWGARHLALNGKTYQEILRHYYPRADLSGLDTEAGTEAGAEVASREIKKPRRL